MLKASISTGVVIISLTGCAPDLTVIPGDGQIESRATAIINGEAPNAPEHASTIGIHQLTSDGLSVYVKPFCSGTIISETANEAVVLTAAHCLATGGRKFRVTSASSLAVYVGDDPSVDLLDHLYLVCEVSVNSGYNPQGFGVNDIALLRLKKSVAETDATPYLPAGSALSVGNTVNFAGFGDDETGEYGVKKQIDGELSAVASTTVTYLQGNGGPCFGDSGGPFFVYPNYPDRTLVYTGGTTSYGDANCTSYGVSMRADAYASYINTFAARTCPTGGTGGGKGGGKPPR